MWKYLLLATLIVGAFIYDPERTIYVAMALITAVIVLRMFTLNKKDKEAV